MSIVRWGICGSDLYIFEHVGGFFRCDVCPFDGNPFDTPDAAIMIEHVRKHVTAGHVVPEFVIPELLARGVMET